MTDPTQLELTDYARAARRAPSLSAPGGEGQGEVAPNSKFKIQNSKFHAPPPADPGEVAQLTALLAAGGTWLTAAQITAQLAWNDRKIRQLAAASSGLIISGNHGYKHTQHATPDEMKEFEGRLINQAKEMIKRALLAKRKHHALLG